MSPAHEQRRWKRCAQSAARRGAVAVEFAAIAPLLLAVIVGLIELSRVYSVQNTLETAAREGARFAALDRSGMMLGGKTANQKLIDDVKNYLAPGGILYFTNIAAGNPYRLWMGLVGEWRLIERTEAGLRRLCARAGIADADVDLVRDTSGLAWLVQIHKREGTTV